MLFLEFHRGNEIPQAILPYKYFFENMPYL